MAESPLMVGRNVQLGMQNVGKCHRWGHYAVICRSRQLVQEVFEEQDYLGESKDHNAGWYTDITLNGY